MAAARAGRPRHAPLRLHPLWKGGPVRHALHWTEGCRLHLLLLPWTGNPPRHRLPFIDLVHCHHRCRHHHWKRSTRMELRHPPGHRKDSQVSLNILCFYAPGFGHSRGQRDYIFLLSVSSIVVTLISQEHLQAISSMMAHLDSTLRLTYNICDERSRSL